MSTKENDIYEENRKEEIISKLTKEQEAILQEFHADHADGVLDDDLAEAYEKWLEESSVKELENMLKIT